MITESYVKFLIKNKLTANQFIVMWCLVQEKRNLLKEYLMSAKVSTEEIGNLIDRSYILNESKEIDFDISKMYPNLEYKELILADVEECARELRRAWSYKNMKVNNNVYPAKNIGITDLTIVYDKIIKGNIMEHFRILQITKDYVENNPECIMGLKKYVELEYWDEIDPDTFKGDFVTDL